MSGPLHTLNVKPLPSWMDLDRLIGVDGAQCTVGPDGMLSVRATVVRSVAADVQARLRGLGFDGRPLQVDVEPPLPRGAVRAARTADARRRRQTTPGFSHPQALTDREGRMSLTPEPLALWMARAARGCTVLDACCGVGGNAIAFARMGCRVTALERVPERVAMARHNADLYGVLDRIRFQTADALRCVPQLTADLLFVDPPWGADWPRAGLGLCQLELLAKLLPHTRTFPEVWLKLPPSFDCRELPFARIRPVFGQAPGDCRRVKFLWLSYIEGQSSPPLDPVERALQADR